MTNMLLPASTAATVSERVALGKAARRRAPRTSHGDWEPAADRPDPVGLLQSQEVARVPELVPIRHGRMLDSEFSFFRGAALGMASDLAPTPTSGIEVQICGDAHLSNFGVFGTPERGMLFDVNDFDETLAGPWEWDVKRLAASLAVAGRDRGFTDQERADIVGAAARSYRTAMRTFAGMSNLDVWYGKQDVSVIETWRAQMGKREKRVVETTLTKAQNRDHLAAFAKLTTSRGGVVRLRDEHPLITPLENLMDPGAAEAMRQSLQGTLDAYASSLPLDRQRLLKTFEPVQMARKVVGVGSVGTRCWIVLLLGRDETDPLILQAKEAEPSVLERYLAPSPFDHHGQRVVEGQRLMQAAGDILLGWVRVNGIDGEQPGLLCPPALGPQGLGGHRRDGPSGHGALRRALRLDPGPGPRPLGRPHRHRRLPGIRPLLRHSDRPLRRGVCRAERGRSPGPGGRAPGRPDRGDARGVSGAPRVDRLRWSEPASSG